MVVPNKRETNLECPKPSPRLGTVKAKNLLPWLTRVHFEANIFDHVWPPHEGEGDMGEWRVKSLITNVESKFYYFKPIWS